MLKIIQQQFSDNTVLCHLHVSNYSMLQIIHASCRHIIRALDINPLMPTVAIWEKLVPDRVKRSFVIFKFLTSGHSGTQG